ncbi:MAG: hypothetical protein ACPGKS_06615 [Coraliomargarita sp.]
MHRASQFLFLCLFTAASVFAGDESMQSGARMMLKLAAAELLEELTQGQIPKSDLMGFAEGMTERYPNLYLISDQEAENLLANEPIASGELFKSQLDLYSKSGHTPTDLLMLLIKKYESGTLSHSQMAFAYQYLRALNEDIAKRSIESSVLD